MKIAFPIDSFNEKEALKTKLARHFGPANFYLITDDNGNFLEKIKNTSTHHGGNKLPPDLLKEYNINIMICNDLGMKALERFDNLNIEVFLSQEMTIEKSFQLWKKNKLSKALSKNVCHGNH